MKRSSSTPGRGIAGWAIALLLATPLLPGGMAIAQGVPGMQPLALPEGTVMRCHAATSSRVATIQLRAGDGRH